VQQVIGSPKYYSNFLEHEDIDEFVLSLSTNMEWADNIEFQAVTDAFQVSIEIINSNQQQFGGARVISPRNCDIACTQHTLGHIEQLHYVSTELLLPLEPAICDGYVESANLRMKNACSLAGQNNGPTNDGLSLSKFSCFFINFKNAKGL
jgi:hypothetical protein